MVCGMGTRWGYEEAEQLTSGQKSTIRRAIREATATLDVSDPSFRATCEKYQKKYGISYDAIRFLMDSRLPAVLPKSTTKQEQGAPGSQDPIEGPHQHRG